MTKTTKRTARKSIETTEKELNMTMNMATAHTGEIDLSADDAILASMLEDIEAGAEDLIAADGLPGDADIIDLGDEAAIEAAIADIEKAEAVQDHYATEEAAGAAGAAGAADEPLVVEKADKPKREKKAKEPKEPKEPRVTYVTGKAADVLKARLGDKTNEMLVLEVEDAGLDPAELEAKQAELLKLLNTRPGTSDTGSTQKKVAEKVVMLFGWLKNGGSLNRVLEITFQTLLKDGEIQSGEKGNLWTALLAKPYSKGTANAQGGQMMAMLPMLKIATKSEKGKLVANPNSMILMAVKARMGL